MELTITLSENLTGCIWVAMMLTVNVMLTVTPTLALSLALTLAVKLHRLQIDGVDANP